MPLNLNLLLGRFRKAEERYRELEAWLSSPDALSDMELYRTRMSEWKSLGGAVEAFRAYRALNEDIAAAEDLLSSAADGEDTEALTDTLSELRDARDKQEQMLLLALLPHNPLDDRNMIVEIRAGAGGEEAALFAADLFRMYSMYAQKNGWGIELIYENETELGGFREIDFLLTGHGIYSKLKYESGVHRVQRIPRTESKGKIQTSTVTVAILPEVAEVDIRLDPRDIKMESCKSSGAGGQHINKTESAVRLTHIPTGLVVECQEERSQLKNREKAMKLLEARLYHMQQQERDSQIASDRKSQVGTGERCERIRTYNFPQGRVTDHRIGLSLYNIDRFMAGELDEIIQALAAQEAESALKGSHEA